MPIILTFDLGTTLFKACLFDGQGALLALARVPTPIDRPQPEWRQIELGRFHEALDQLAANLRQQAPEAFARTEAISFATQTNSFLLLDENDQPLTPILVWNDARATEFKNELDDIQRQPGFHNETGLTGVGIYFTPPKLLWLQRHQPDIFRRARAFRLIGDQLVARLTGRHVTEAGAAGLTGLLDIHRLQWRQDALDAVGLSNVSMPTSMRAGTDLGAITPHIADHWQLPPGCRVVLGCLDQYAGAIGAGNVKPAGLSETTGTVLATVRLAETFNTDPIPGVIQGPAWRDGLWWRMAFSSISANLLEALRNAEPDAPSFDTLGDEAAATPPGAVGLRLDPEKSAAAGEPVFLNLQPYHTRGHRVRAVFEAVAQTLQSQVTSLGATDAPAIHAVGGAARSSIWLQIKADLLGIPFTAMDTPEPTSLGAAALALASLADEPLPDVASRLARVRAVIQPTTLSHP